MLQKRKNRSVHMCMRGRESPNIIHKQLRNRGWEHIRVHCTMLLTFLWIWNLSKTKLRIKIIVAEREQLREEEVTTPIPPPLASEPWLGPHTGLWALRTPFSPLFLQHPGSEHVFSNHTCMTPSLRGVLLGSHGRVNSGTNKSRWWSQVWHS